MEPFPFVCVRKDDTPSEKYRSYLERQLKTAADPGLQIC